MRSRKQRWVALATAVLLGGSTLAGTTVHAAPAADGSVTVVGAPGTPTGSGADGGTGTHRSGLADLTCAWDGATFEAPLTWAAVDGHGSTKVTLPRLALPAQESAARGDARVTSLDVTAVLDVEGRRVEVSGERRHDESLPLGAELALPTLTGDSADGEHVSLTSLSVRLSGPGLTEAARLACTTGVLDQEAPPVIPDARARTNERTPVPAAAAAATGATVSGRVTVPAGIDPEDVRVYAWYPIQETWFEDGEEYTWTDWDYDERTWVAEDGTYTFDDLRAGQYVFEFRHDDAFGYHGGDSRDTATRVAVRDGATLTGIDAVMRRYGSASGTVRSAGGVPLESGSVTAYRWTDHGDGEGYFEYETDAWVEDGAFRVAGLPAGTYVFALDGGRFNDTTWFGGTSEEDATRIEIALGDESDGIDIVFEERGAIEGWLDPSAEAHLVWLYRWQDGRWVQQSRTSSSPWGDPEDARYTFGGLAAGTYRIGLARYDDIDDFYVDADLPVGGSPTTWFPASTTLAGAQDVVVAPGRVSRADFVQSPFGSVSGRITAPAGMDAADFVVDAYRVAGDDDLDWAREVQVRRDGTYLLEDLLPGTYRIAVNHVDHLVDGVAWRDAPSAWEGDDVTVTRGSETTGISMTVVRNGSISGSVRGVGGATAEQYEVGLFGWASGGSSEFAELIDTTTVDASGRFTFSDVRAHTYYLGVRDTSVPSAWSMLGGGSSPLDSTKVVLGKAQDLTGFVLSLETGVVKGRVTGPGGVPVAGADVYLEALRPDGSAGGAGYVSAATDGTWTLHGVGPGTYRVIAYGPDDLVWNWFGDARHFNHAQDVVLGTGQTRTGIDIALVRGGHLAGTVGATDPDALVVLKYYRLEDGEWRLYGEDAYWGDDGDFGTFETGLFHPGRYRVGIAPGWDEAPRTFVGGTTLATATEFTVRSGETTSGVVAHLPDRAPTVTQPPSPPSPPRPPAPPVAKVLKLVKAPKVTGKAKVGKTLKASKGTWRSTGPKAKVTVKFQWQSQKGKKAVNVAKATKSKLKLTKKLKGKQVRVRVTVSAPGHKSIVHVGKWSKKVA